jgi:Transcription factor WhiB
MALEAPAVRVLADLLSRPAWHRQAACAGQGTTEFIPVRGANYDRARALCAGCPVRQECLETALADSELLGLWAGTTPGPAQGDAAWRCVGGFRCRPGASARIQPSGECRRPYPRSLSHLLVRVIPGLEFQDAAQAYHCVF